MDCRVEPGNDELTHFPGAAQHVAKWSGALQTWDRRKLGKCGDREDPGSAVHR
jgi:hypothetical protein